mmetsp:Transcript_96151/g.250696  ORF Transcript_96151/g.250696 Transcript_96151/m.250696 type:complete len:258 (-) Transcript_96151:583-1356(-)
MPIRSNLQLRRRWRLGQGALTDGAPQEGIGHRPHVCTLLVVGSTTMSSFDVLPVEHLRRLVSRHLIQQPSDHLSCVPRVHTVVLGRCREQHLWTLPIRARLQAHVVEPVVWRKGLDELPFLRVVWISVLSHPRSAREQCVISLHVQQRHLAHYGAEKLRPLTREHIADKQASVGSTYTRQAPWGSHTSRNEISSHGLEVLIGLVAVLLQGCLMPRRPELPATADVGDHLGTAPLQPRCAHASGIAWSHGDLEAAVPV